MIKTHTRTTPPLAASCLNHYIINLYSAHLNEESSSLFPLILFIEKSEGVFFA